MPKKHYPWEFWAIPKQIAEFKDLQELDKLIIGVFVTRQNGENEVPAKMRTLSEQLGVSESSIKRSLERLKEKKYIKSIRIGKNRANQYQLKI